MPAATPSVRVLVVDPVDIAAPRSGGVLTFLLDFIKFAPPDFEITVAGVTEDPVARPIGKRIRVPIGTRAAWSLPLAPAGAIPRNPLRLAALTFAQLRLRREMLDGRRILQVHRPYRRSILAGLRGARVQFIHVDMRESPGPSGWWQPRWLYGESSDRALQRCARVFVVNESGAMMLRQRFPRIADRIEFLPVWFDGAIFRLPRAAERAELRESVLARLGDVESAGRQRLILFAGRIDQNKDPELAIDAFAELTRTTNETCRLLIAGDGDMRAAAKARARELGVAERVHLLGDLPREELAQLMRACDVLLLTSRAEGGGPRVVVEALASGLPVVATPVGEVRRTVQHGINGWLIQERSAAAVARGLRWVIEQPRGALAGAAADCVAPYAAHETLSHLYDAYRQLAADNEGGRHRTA